MRIVVDFDACQCMALCAVSAPDIFEIMEQGTLEVKIEEPGEQYRDAVEQAVRECPLQAISIE